MKIHKLQTKLTSGKRLTKAELAALQAAAKPTTLADGVGMASNQVDLGEALGVTRKTIQRWLREPGNPGARSNGQYDVPKWRQWARTNGHKLGDDYDLTRLKAENLILQNRKLEANIAILEKHWVPVIDVERVGNELGAAVRKVVSTIHLAAPTIVGRPLDEVDRILKDKEDEIIDQLHVLHTRLEEVKATRPEDAADAGAE